ncbi:hypothetical protein ACFLZH_00970 [Patescibacteria group bacterium]
MLEVKVGQKWRNKATGELVKVLKVGSSLIRVQDREGSDYGTQEDIQKDILTNKYILIK